MPGFIPALIEGIHEAVDPSYMKEKEQAKEACLVLETTSQVALVSAVALAALGITLMATAGVAGIVFGTLFLAVALPLGYVSYNSYRVSDNLSKVINCPKEYMKFNGLAPAFDSNKLYKKLRKRTFCCDFMVKKLAYEIAKN